MRRVAGVEVLRCPCCAVGRLRVVQALFGLARLPPSGSDARTIACRGRREVRTIDEAWSNAMPFIDKQGAAWASLDDGIHHK